MLKGQFIGEVQMRYDLQKRVLKGLKGSLPEKYYYAQRVLIVDHKEPKGAFSAHL